MILPIFKNAVVPLDKLQDWIDLQIASVDIFLDNNKDLPSRDINYHYGKIEAFEHIKTHVHELVK